MLIAKRHGKEVEVSILYFLYRPESWWGLLAIFQAKSALQQCSATSIFWEPAGLLIEELRTKGIIGVSMMVVSLFYSRRNQTVSLNVGFQIGPLLLGGSISHCDDSLYSNT